MTSGLRHGGPLVIAFGNELRGDDGAAHVTARLLTETPGFAGRVIQIHQLGPDIAEELAASEVVFFVDARRPDGCLEIQCSELTPGVDVRLPLGHALTPQHVLTLCAALYGRWPRAYLVTIPTETFEFGTECSETAVRGAHAAAALILKRIQE